MMIELPRLPLISLDTAEETTTHEIARSQHIVIGKLVGVIFCVEVAFFRLKY
jgi:hypothetical protein